VLGAFGGEARDFLGRCTQRRKVASSNWLQVATPCRLPKYEVTASETLSTAPAVEMELRAVRTLPSRLPVSAASASSAVLKPSTFFRMSWASVWERIAIGLMC